LGHGVVIPQLSLGLVGLAQRLVSGFALTKYHCELVNLTAYLSAWHEISTAVNKTPQNKELPN